MTELADEGVAVRAGEVLARFDDSSLRRELVGLRRDAALARADLDVLRHAVLPLEQAERETAAAEAREEAEEDAGLLEDLRALLADDLVSPREIAAQEARAQRRREAARREARRAELTVAFLHPARLARAQATLDAAGQALALAEERLQNCTVRAPADGVVVHPPLHVGREYRAARVGDTLFTNQPFVEVQDLRNPVVDFLVPEAEVEGVRPGAPVRVRLPAVAGLERSGSVSAVGPVAQAVPGRPAWEKFFRARAALQGPPGPLRAGMTARAEVRTAHRDRALLLPRTAVWWAGEKPLVRVRTAGGLATREVRLGAGNAGAFEVLAGLEAGERVLLP